MQAKCTRGTPRLTQNNRMVSPYPRARSIISTTTSRPTKSHIASQKSSVIAPPVTQSPLKPTALAVSFQSLIWFAKRTMLFRFPFRRNSSRIWGRDAGWWVVELDIARLWISGSCWWNWLWGWQGRIYQARGDYARSWWEHEGEGHSKEEWMSLEGYSDLPKLHILPIFESWGIHMWKTLAPSSILLRQSQNFVSSIWMFLSDSGLLHHIINYVGVQWFVS